VQVLVFFLWAIGRCESLDCIGVISLDFGFLCFIGMDSGSLCKVELDYGS
jgi:hypothetical protein